MDSAQLCHLSSPEAIHPLWVELGTTAWESRTTLTMRSALQELEIGSTAGAKLIAAGLMPPVPVRGYVHPRTSRASVDFLLERPKMEAEDLNSRKGALVLRASGPMPADDDPPSVPERPYSGYHRTFSRWQQAVYTAAWWGMRPRISGIADVDVPVGGRFKTYVDELFVTVANLVVLHAKVDAIHVVHGRIPSRSLPLTAFELSDPSQDCTGYWLPPTRSGNTVVRARDW